MALTIKHNFVDTHADGADATLVRPSNWNDTHSVAGILDPTQFPALTGAVTSPGGSTVTTIAPELTLTALALGGAVIGPFALAVGANDVFIQGSNETTTIVDGVGVVDNSTVAIQRIVTSLNVSPIQGLLIDVQNNNSISGQVTRGMYSLVSTPPGNSTTQANQIAILGTVAYSGLGNVGNIFAANYAVENLGAATIIGAMVGDQVVIFNSGGGNVPASDCFRAQTPVGATTGLTSVWGGQHGVHILDQNPTGAGTNTLTNPPVGLLIESQSAPGAFAIKQSGSGINSFDGQIYGTAIATTASAANAFINTGSTPAGQLMRSTSSLAYKRDVEPVDLNIAKKVLSNAKPIFYRSKCLADNPAWSWYGLGAEDIAVLDPRLVHWGYQDDDFDMVEFEAVPAVDSAPAVIGHKKQLKEGAKPKPDGVQYERLIALLILGWQDQEARLAALELHLG